MKRRGAREIGRKEINIFLHRQQNYLPRNSWEIQLKYTNIIGEFGKVLGFKINIKINCISTKWQQTIGK